MMNGIEIEAAAQEAGVPGVEVLLPGIASGNVKMKGRDWREGAERFALDISRDVGFG